MAAEAITLDQILEFVRRKVADAEDSIRYRDEGVRRINDALAAYVNAQRDHERLRIAASLGMTVAVPDAELAALALLEAVEALPEIATGRPSRVIIPTREQAMPAFPEDDEGAFLPRFPTLRVATYERRLLLVGGLPVERKLRWVQEVIAAPEEFHDNVEWYATEDDPDARTCARVANEMKAGTICGVVYFPDFMSHPQTDALLRGGREQGVPVAPAGRGGQAALLGAFDIIEKQLATKGTP